MNTVVADAIGDIALVIAISALRGALARRSGQPTVIGQTLARQILGPSLLRRLPVTPPVGCSWASCCHR